MLVVACNMRANIIRIPRKSQNACDCPFNDILSLGEHYTDAGGGLQHEGEHHQDPQQDSKCL
jgi:hypothetical protein